MAVPAHARFGVSTKRLVFAILTVVGVGMMAAAQPVRSGTGEVIAIRELEMKPDVNVAEFERFVRGTYNPAWEGAIPGVRGYIARADRGAHKGRYALFLVFDSEKTRDTIFPEEGAGASDAFARLVERPLSLNKELDTFIEPASFSVYTDYVALR